MTARTRKFVGLIAFMAYLFVYVVVVASIAGHLPPSRWAWAAFYVIAGTGWGVPLFPLIRWMERGR